MIPLQEGVDVEPVRRIPSVMLALLRIGLAAMASLAATWAGAAVPAAARTCEAADWTVGGAGVEHPRADCAAGPVLNAGSYREVWRRDYDGLLEFPPSYAGGVLYTAMDNGWVTAQRTTGSVVWSRRFTTPWPHGPRDAHYNAIVHTPTYWNGRLYVQTKNMGRIWCLDAATGKTIWRFVNMGGEAAPIVIPTRRGPRVYAVEREGRVVVLDALTGEPIWAKQMLGHTTSALAYSDRRLFGSDYDGNVIAFKRNGNVVWRRHLAFSSSYANMAVRYGRLYAVSRLGWAFSLGTGAGRVRWKTRTTGITYGHPAVADGHVYTESIDGTFWKLSAWTGKVEWTTHHTRAIGGPVVLGRRVYFSEMGRRGRPGRVIGYNVGTMRQVFWWPDGKYSPVVAAGRTLVVVGLRKLYALRPVL